VPPEPPAKKRPGLNASALAEGSPPCRRAGSLPPGVPDEPKKYVLGNQVTVAVARERVQYLNAQGKLITESLRDYTRINLTKRFDSLDKFLQAWHSADRKAALVQELEQQGVLIEALAEELALEPACKDLDPFDLLLHVAYNHAPAHPARARPPCEAAQPCSPNTAHVARKVIDALLDKYADEGMATIESRRGAEASSPSQTSVARWN
jgi:type I restriction enzyme R subunit